MKNAFTLLLLITTMSLCLFFTGFTLITAGLVWILGCIYIGITELGLYRSWIKKYKAWSKKRYWAKRHLDFLKVALREDARWLSVNKLTGEVANRHEDMVSDNWYELSFEDITQFRNRLGIDPHTKVDPSGVGYGTHRVVSLELLASVCSALSRSQPSPNTYAKVRELIAEEGVSFDKNGITLIKPVRGELNKYHKAEQLKIKPDRYKYFLLDIDALNAVLGQLVISAPHSNAKRLIESIASTTGVTSRFDENRDMWVYGYFLEDRIQEQSSTDINMEINHRLYNSVDLDQPF